MKKAMFLLLGAGMMLGMVACKKDYTCACTFKLAGATTSTTFNLLINDAKKSDAESACDQAETTYKIADASATCTLN
jgi:hypothetical protein